MAHTRYRKKHRARTAVISIILSILALCMGISGYHAFKTRIPFTEAVMRLYAQVTEALSGSSSVQLTGGWFDPSEIPQWDGKTVSFIVNENIPYFTPEDLKDPIPYISYASLDWMGRCREVNACLSADLLPKGERHDEEVRATIRPTGFLQAEYDFIEDSYLYHRSHLLGWQLGGDTIYENTVTGTRSMNIEGMLPYENEVAYYLLRHRSALVLYRVTPVYKGDDLICSGVLMEYYSINDNGRLHGCVYLYNEEPGVIIDHASGESQAADTVFLQ